MTLIETVGVSKAYGSFVALDNVSLTVARGELLSIVGPNGAGKTTLVNVLTGLLKPTSGTVRFKGDDIAGIGPVALAKRGMARAFQLVHIFPAMTVAQTIGVAVVSQASKSFRMFASVANDQALRSRVSEVAAIFGLDTKLDTESRLLSQGEKKLLDIASAFALTPEVILLDEPTSGVSSGDKHGIMRTLLDAAKHAGVQAIILVEHDMNLVAEYSTRIVALKEGRVLADLPPDRFFKDPEIVAAVVGKLVGKMSKRVGVMLVLDQLTVDIQNSRILRGISLKVAAGQLVCLIGRNGAGKTTTFRTIMGYLTPVSGTVALNDTSIIGLPTHKIAQLGIGYAPEESQVFGDLNVAENIELPTWTRPQGRDATTRIAMAYEIFPKLRELRHARRQPAVGRRTQDGVDCARADARRRAAAARRAVRRAVAGNHSEHQRGHSVDSPARARDPDGGVEHSPYSRLRRQLVCSGARRDYLCRHARRCARIGRGHERHQRRSLISGRDAMPKILTEAQVEQFRRDGCVFPVRVMPEDQALEIRRQLEDYENEIRRAARRRPAPQDTSAVSLARGSGAQSAHRGCDRRPVRAQSAVLDNEFFHQGSKQPGVRVVASGLDLLGA